MTNPQVSKLQSVMLPTPYFVFSPSLTELMPRQGTNISRPVASAWHYVPSLVSERVVCGGQPVKR